ncbi:U5 small nuclear ribonucleoprotein 40 kDa [Fasciola gigantica]|uniref:U5 small nuclear ribonucleoprotein 40 kDa protein n=1 Tax=Fasciola gigantica TaxID=46835 RepID=A0A504YCM9_FASGI|nr:U5 small nuclear ribonucleoprotein 40 kDa [Fasciola gigantica]
MDFKRPLAGVTSMSMVPLPAKKTRYESTPLALVQYGGKTSSQIVPAGQPGSIPRTSGLQAPNMLLNGHDSEIYCGKFASDGTFLVSAGFDRKIMIWETYGDCENIATLLGHGSAILDLILSADDAVIYTASADKSVGLWDTNLAKRIKRFRGHQNVVNSCGLARRGPQLVCSGSDDGTVKLWDRRQKTHVQSFQNTYQVLSVTFNDTAEMIFSGGIDNVIKGWDIRKLDVSMLLTGHTDTVTGLSVSPDGSFLLSNAMDNTLRMWDIRPFAPPERCMKVFVGHQHTFEKNMLRCAWSADGRRITCGSGDRYVHVWDVSTRQLVYKLPGHTASVNETAFHPCEPILLSVGSDKKIFLGEILPCY